MQHDIEKLHKYNHMPAEVKVIYDLCKNSKLEYQTEEPGEDYWKAPYETERDGGGDCEDLSIWLLYKLWDLGYDAWLQMGIDDYNMHMWVRVRISDGRFSYFYDVDMVEKFVRPAWREVRFSQPFYDKLAEVYERRLKHIKGKIK